MSSRAVYLKFRTIFPEVKDFKMKSEAVDLIDLGLELELTHRSGHCWLMTDDNKILYISTV